jgi:drug/metabolite transporter (DMT)-like permease
LAPYIPSRTIIALAVGVMCLVWGSTWVVIAEGLDDLPPFTSAAIRFGVAALVMAGVAKVFARKEGGVAPPRRLVLAMGVLNFAVSYGIVYWTETRLPSGMVSLLWGIYPIMMAAVGHLMIPGERLRGRQWAGFAVGFTGIAVLFRTDLASIEGAGAAGLLLLLSPAVSAIGTGIVKREGEGVSSLWLNRDGMALSALLLGVVAVVFEQDAAREWTQPALLSIAYLALCGTCLTFGLYYWIMRYAPAYQLSLIAYVTPAIAISLGALVRDEPITRSMLTGGALVLGGVALVMLGKVRARPDQKRIGSRR